MPVQNDVDDSDYFGFLSVVSVGTTAYIGGFLILNAMGRPLEFHCTEAVKPNRAQEILYGNTLQPFVFADQIGKALAGASKIKPTLLFVDATESLDLREHVDSPVFLLQEESSFTSSDVKSLPVENFVLTPWNRSQDDIDAVTERQIEMLSDWDLLEPFQRIHDAIQETSKAA